MAGSGDEEAGSLTNRLMSRADPGLQRRGMADGGEVYSGRTASRALRAIGARAMTMDETIFVDDGFDPSNSEDAALYAHERHHQAESGGTDDGHGSHDAEEVTARAMERMVHHRMERGDDLASILADVKSGNVGAEPGNAETAGAHPGGELDLTEGDAMRAYADMIAEGKDHMTIVRELVDHCLQQVQRQSEDHLFRTAERGIL